jgi:hypothetical protein
MLPQSKIYLSVDLDAFITPETQGCFDDVFRHVIGGGLPVKVVPSHHKLIPDINRSGVTALWNVDQHDDLECETCGDERCYCYHAPRTLHCGNWVSHVKWRQGGEYHWLAPRKRNIECYGWVNPWGDPEHHRWQRLIKHDLDRTRIPWGQVCRIGIAVSPDYTTPTDLRDRLQACPVPGVAEWFRVTGIAQRASRWSLVWASRDIEAPDPQDLSDDWKAVAQSAPFQG